MMKCKDCKWRGSCIMAAPDGCWEACGRFEADAGDLISREQTISALENLGWYHINANGELKAGANSACDTPLYKADDVYAVLRKAPSAEKTGRWKPFDLTWGRSIYFCTACNDASEVPVSMGEPVYKFCPWCGARMGVE